MISIDLSVLGDNALNISDLRSDGDEISITQQMERDAFETVFDNVRLKISNIDGRLTDPSNGIFRRSGTRRLATTRYRVVIRDTDRLQDGDGPEAAAIFRGEIDNESLKFPADEWVVFDAFSMTKLFWERAKNVKVSHWQRRPSQETDTLYLTVSQLLDLLLSHSAFTDLYRGIDIRNGYGTRSIRYEGPVTPGVPPPETGLQGRFIDLDPDTTIEQLLTAMAMWYNAEFYIDPATENFVMQRRYGATGRAIDVSGLICEEPGMELDYLDRAKYDFIYMIFAIFAQEPAQFVRFTTPWNKYDLESYLNVSPAPQLFIYHLTSVFADGMETGPSAPLSVTVPGTVVNSHIEHAGQNSITVIDSIDAKAVVLTIPPPVQDAITVRIYRTDVYHGLGGSIIYAPPSLLYEHNFQQADPNAIIYEPWEFVDGDGTNRVRVDPAQPLKTRGTGSPATGWVGYDEQNNNWPPIIREGALYQATPVGKIFKVLPDLRFVGRNTGEQLRYNLMDMYAFFGKDYTPDTVRNDFANLLQTAQAIHCKVARTGFRVGDRITGFHGPDSPLGNSIEFSDQVLVKRAVTEVNEGTTELELVCLPALPSAS